MDLLSQETCCGSYSPHDEGGNAQLATSPYPPSETSQTQWHVGAIKTELSALEGNCSPPLIVNVPMQQQQPVVQPCSSRWRLPLGVVKSEPTEVVSPQANSPTHPTMPTSMAASTPLQRQAQPEPGASTSQQYFRAQSTEPPLPVGFSSSNKLDLRIHTNMQSPQQQYEAQQQLYAQMSPSYVFQHQLQLSQPNTPCFVPAVNNRGVPGTSDCGGSYVDPKAHLVYMRNQQPRQQPHVHPQKTDMIPTRLDYPPEAPPPDSWCHAYYYELNQRVGEPFKGGRSHVTVDGFCAPSEAERFCLGALANVNRNPGVINARRQIGRGVRIFCRDDDVYAECLSEAPIFVQSPIHALQSHDHPATVYRLPPGHTMQIFDNRSFEALIKQTSSQGFNAVYSLQRMCHVRISFVKGWGEQYKRQTITSTPCWIELHLPVPLQKLDRLLTAVAGPAGSMHSFT